jgi:hypothetical protein
LVEKYEQGDAGVCFLILGDRGKFSTYFFKLLFSKNCRNQEENSRISLVVFFGGTSDESPNLYHFMLLDSVTDCGWFLPSSMKNLVLSTGFCLGVVHMIRHMIFRDFRPSLPLRNAKFYKFLYF